MLKDVSYMELWWCYQYGSRGMEWKDGNYWIVCLYEVCAFRV